MSPTLSATHSGPVPSPVRSSSPRATWHGILRLHVARVKAVTRFVVSRDHRRRSVALARYVAEGTSWEGRPRRVALRHLTGRAVSEVVQRDPSLTSRTVLNGLGTLRDAHAAGRGVILASIHSHAMWSAIRALVAEGLDLHIVVGPWFWDEASGGAAHRRSLEAEGVTLISSDDAGHAVPALLATGGICVITVDIPGRRVVTLAGKRATVMPGTAKLASRTGAIVVVAVPFVDGTRPRLDFLPAIDPRELAGPNEVLAAVARTLDEPMGDRCHGWSPHTSELWPDTVAPYLWAFKSTP